MRRRQLDDCSGIRPKVLEVEKEAINQDLGRAADQSRQAAIDGHRNACGALIIGKTHDVANWQPACAGLVRGSSKERRSVAF
jgi:hypothetical protein